jgi:hypothetical protein
VHKFTSVSLRSSDTPNPGENASVLTTALAVAAALVAVAFGASTFERWTVKRRPQDLSWSISLLFFAVGASALAYGAMAGWSGISFRVFYAFGAIVNVPFLAAGQLQLQLPRRYSSLVLWVVSLFSALSVGVVFAAPFTKAVGGAELPRGKDVFPIGPRLFAAIGSGVSAFIVFAGTIIGVVAILRARDRIPGAGRRAAGLGLLALGAATLSASGTLNSRFGEMRAFSITLTAGIVLLFAGFLLTSAGSLRRAPSDRSAQGAAEHFALQPLR